MLRLGVILKLRIVRLPIPARERPSRTFFPAFEVQTAERASSVVLPYRSPYHWAMRAEMRADEIEWGTVWCADPEDVNSTAACPV